MAQVSKIWQSGLLDHRIIISKPKYIKATDGEITETAPDNFKIWANRVDQETSNLNENESAFQIVASGRTTFVIRYKNWLNERCIITDNSTNDVFEIEGIAVIGRNEAQSIVCKRKDNLTVKVC